MALWKWREGSGSVSQKGWEEWFSFLSVFPPSHFWKADKGGRSHWPKISWSLYLPGSSVNGLVSQFPNYHHFFCYNQIFFLLSFYYIHHLLSLPSSCNSKLRSFDQIWRKGVCVRERERQKPTVNFLVACCLRSLTLERSWVGEAK